MDTHHTQYCAPISPVRSTYSHTTSSSRSSTASPTKHISRPSEGFFTRLSMSFASALRTTPDEDRAREAELEWTCRGTDHGNQYWGPSALVQEDYPYFGARRDSTQSSSSGPLSAGRTPSLTHSRGSSTDSGFTSDCLAHADRHKQFKALPAIPDIPEIYATRNGAVAALLTRSGSGNSSEEIARAQLAIQQLDLAVPPEFVLLTASPVPSTISTLRRPASVYTAGGSPRTVWTPRASCFGTPATVSEEAFAFENTLAAYEEFDRIASRQQALDRLNNKAPKPRRTQSIKEQFPYFADVDEEPECEVVETFTPPVDDTTPPELPESPQQAGQALQADEVASDEETSLASAKTDDTASTYGMLESALFDMLASISCSPSSPATSFVEPVSDVEDEFVEDLPSNRRTSYRASITYSRHQPATSGSGWRGWRSSTLISPAPQVADESMPDFAIELSAMPAFNTFQPAQDYFTPSKPDDYVDADASPTSEEPASDKLTIPTATKRPLSGSSLSSSLSVGESAALPKLSPDFRFGTSRVSTPIPTSPVQAQRFSQASQTSAYSVESTYSIDSQARRLRSASANELRSKAAEWEAGSSTPQSGYRVKRGMRNTRIGAPSMQMRSFDAEALKRLRASSSSSSLYEWI